MRETILYMRGPMPFGPEYGIPDDLIRDAKALLDLDVEVIGSIRDELQAFRGFLDRGTIEGIVHSYVANEESCHRLARLIVDIDGRFRATGQNVDEFLSRIQEWLDDEENQRKGLLCEQEFAELRERLPLVVGPFPGRTRQAKAARLSQATGLPLEKIEIICDLRPVFDKDKESVEGMIPYTTLRIVCKGADGLPVALEAILSNDDVAQLAEASGDAKKKLARLGKLMQEKELTVPHIAMTREGDTK